ncbi:hypothetical protein AAU01_38420 [Paenarthrobacter aurescens]|uniref:Uncharacterized protein n=1 Tax=Paenarthrobacter aurescens TaxID=43663 RepID=A0A4Y3NJD5_PAEAU|nr:hypothetical protein AAU01_38420 [Paenarthrobacter aurescens]
MPTLVVSTDDIRIAVLAAVAVRELLGSFIKLKICGMSDAMGSSEGSLTSRCRCAAIMVTRLRAILIGFL